MTHSIMFFLLCLASSWQILPSYGIKNLKNGLLKVGRIWEPQLLVIYVTGITEYTG